MGDLRNVVIHTDGACIGNPGPGGYGVILQHRGHRQELGGGYRRTTNNRMELLAVIKGLEALKEKCQVTIYSDSQYVINGISKGWAQQWRANGWKRNKKENAINPDLWEKLLRLCERHHVEFKWVRGHSGDPENERCDYLAMQAAQQPDLAIDEGYESSIGSKR